MFAEFTVDTLIDDYGKDYEVLGNTNDGAHNKAGIYKPPAPVWQPGFGAIVDLTSKDFRSDTEGAYTSQDRKCFTRDNYEIGNQIRTSDGEEYTVSARNNYSEFDQTDVFAYTLKRKGTLANSNVG